MYILRVLATCFFLFPMYFFAQQTKIEDEVALLAARGDLEKLRPLYDSVRSSLSPHTSLYCQFALARGAGHHREVVTLVDSLERFYERKLDVRGLLALAQERCEALFALGAYSELKSYCDDRLSWAQRRSVRQSRRNTLRFYQALGKQWTSVPAPTETWRNESFSIPLTRDWPLLIPGAMGSSELLPFLLDTGHHHSLISQEDAETLGIQPLTDNLLIATAVGWVNARPALLPTLQIGDLTLTDIPVFVVDETVSAPFNRSLGTDVLHRFQHLTFSDAHLQISRQAANAAPASETFALAFSTDGGLDVQPLGASSTYPAPLELAFPDSLTTAESLIHRTAFLRSARQNYFDLVSMRLYRQQPRSNYHPRSVSDYLSDNDYFGLLNNEIALTYTATPEEISRMTAVLNHHLESALPLNIPQGLPNSIEPLSVVPSFQAVKLLYRKGDVKRRVTVQVSQQAMMTEINPLHLLSQISLTTARRLKLPLYKSTQGKLWALIPDFRAGGVVVSHLLCLVVNTPEEGMILGLDLLSRIPAITFASDGIIFHPNRQADALLPYERLFVVTPIGVIVQDNTLPESSSRSLRLSDYQGKTLDFEQMSIQEYPPIAQ